MIEVTHGEPLPNDEEAVEVYGMKHNTMDSVLGDGESQLLMDKAFQIIYGFNKGIKKTKTKQRGAANHADISSMMM